VYAHVVLGYWEAWVERVVTPWRRKTGYAFTPFFLSKEYFWRAYGRLALLLGMLYVSVGVSTMVGRGFAGVYKLFEQEGVVSPDFYLQLCHVGTLFVITAGCNMVVSYNTRMFALDWRRAITHHFLPLLEKIIGKDKIAGVSQRIQQEAYEFTKFVDSFGLQIFRAVFTLFAFLPQLWELSPILHVKIPAQLWGLDSMLSLGLPIQTSIQGVPFFDVHGILSFIAFVVAVIGTSISCRIGRDFPALEKRNHEMEAAFRDKMVVIEAGKEPFDIAIIHEHFDRACGSYVKMFRRFMTFDLWADSYWGSTAIIPVLVVGGWILSGMATVPVLIQIAYVFRESIGSFSIFMSSWTRIVDFSATYQRLRELEEVLKEDLCDVQEKETTFGCWDFSGIAAFTSLEQGVHVSFFGEK
jgi:peptide/bleomycin uptake transporter